VTLRLSFAIWSVSAAIAAAEPFKLPDDEAAASFVVSNVLSTFYHELGHGLIDILDLPVLGREEDAADTLAALLVHETWQEEQARRILYDAAEAYLLLDAEAKATGSEPDLADTHSLDLQRYYNLVCLYYGADPDMREDDARELSLPETRAETCAEEFELAQASWGGILDGLEPGPDAKGLRIVKAEADDDVVAILQTDIDDLNARYGLPVWIDVWIEPCGEANAFYYPGESRITICSEYAPDLVRLWEEASQ
jgi:hypothetical protein